MGNSILLSIFLLSSIVGIFAFPLNEEAKTDDLECMNLNEKLDQKCLLVCETRKKEGQEVVGHECNSNGQCDCRFGESTGEPSPSKRQGLPGLPGANIGGIGTGSLTAIVSIVLALLGVG
jgi:hypothetical protein